MESMQKIDSSEPKPRMVSVVIPTLGRAKQLAEAVRSVLDQELPNGIALEVVIAVSDPGSRADVEKAYELAADSRVIVALARARGAGAARNAGIAASQGSIVAFIDDDCVARPGWLMAALAALEDADLVQGRTVAARPKGWLEHSVQVDPPSWRWETCNLVARREAVDRAGPFDESWNSEGRIGAQYGEDVEWGWRVVRRGARPAFTRDAVVEHAVQPRTLRSDVAYHARLRYYPRLFRNTPEARRAFYRGYFVSRRHVALVAAIGLAGAGAWVRSSGRPRLSRTLLATAGATYLSGYQQLARQLGGEIADRLVTEGVQVGALVYGSIRWRRPLL